jgi:hypothetical protein
MALKISAQGNLPDDPNHIKVVCVFSRQFGPGNIFTGGVKASSDISSITIGKVYDAVEIGGFQYEILSDEGTTCWLNRGYFATLEEWRNSQINKLI